jgi:hypothetical protein
VDTLILQTVVGAVVVLVVGVVLLRRRTKLRAQGDEADPRVLAGIENRVRILGVLAIFFVLWSVVRFTPS